MYYLSISIVYFIDMYLFILPYVQCVCNVSVYVWAQGIFPDRSALGFLNETDECVETDGSVWFCCTCLKNSGSFKLKHD